MKKSKEPVVGRLRKEIVSSNGKNKVIYGTKDEPVTIISTLGNVFIVEGKTGKFAVNEKDLREN